MMSQLRHSRVTRGLNNALLKYASDTIASPITLVINSVFEQCRAKTCGRTGRGATLLSRQSYIPLLQLIQHLEIALRGHLSVAVMLDCLKATAGSSWKIVLDSAYSLLDRAFADNLGSILVYAVLGTIINFVLIGPTLWLASYAGAMGDFSLTLRDCLLFSSFIVAVDPVAVLAIFQDVGVYNVLYFLVFGESLLNDAVTIVLSNTMKTFIFMDSILASEVFLGIASFFTVSLGGLIIGITCGLLSSLITRATTRIRVVEPIVLLGMAYMSLLMAELVHWSGIISMIGCGMTQAAYGFHNISHKSYTTVKYFGKTVSTLCDATIFLFLGVSVVRDTHEWQFGFIVWALVCCLVYRAVTVFGLTFIINKRRVHPVTLEEQFLMWYGGLRGAICFALCETISNSYPLKNTFLTTTTVIVLVTVFVMGTTIKPLVSCCKIQRKQEGLSMFEEINTQALNHVLSAIEIIIDHRGGNRFRSWLIEKNDTCLRPIFQTDSRTRDQQIVDIYKKIALKDYVSHLGEDTVKSRESQSLHTRTQTVGSDLDREAGDNISAEDDLRTALHQRPNPVAPTPRRTLFRRSRSQDVNTATDLRRLLLDSVPRNNIMTGRSRQSGLSKEEDHPMTGLLREKHERITRLVNWRLKSVVTLAKGQSGAGSQRDDSQLRENTLPEQEEFPLLQSDMNTSDGRLRRSLSHPV